MAKRVKQGFWIVLILGAKAYLQHRGNHNPKAADIYQVLDDLGFLKGVLSKRTPASIRLTIYQFSRNFNEGAELNLA